MVLAFSWATSSGKYMRIEEGGRLMKLKITEIEATAEDLRQSRTLSEALTNLLRTGLIPDVSVETTEDEEEEEST